MAFPAAKYRPVGPPVPMTTNALPAGAADRGKIATQTIAATATAARENRSITPAEILLGEYRSDFVGLRAACQRPSINGVDGGGPVPAPYPHVADFPERKPMLPRPLPGAP